MLVLETNYYQTKRCSQLLYCHSGVLWPSSGTSAYRIYSRHRCGCRKVKIIRTSPSKTSNPKMRQSAHFKQERKKYSVPCINEIGFPGLALLSQAVILRPDDQQVVYLLESIPNEGSICGIPSQSLLRPY